jgi:phosphatidylglycerophosphate synthase
MLSNRLGHFLDKPLAPLAKKITINPNKITIIGFIITALAAVILNRSLFWGGICIIIGGLFDMLDGVVARVNRRATSFGAFLDSVLDRYSDAFLLIGFAWIFYTQGSLTGVILSIGTLTGSLIISYARARAEGLGEECQAGILERPERMIFLIIGALTEMILPMMWILCVFTHVTVIQRILHVREVMK